MSKIIAHCLVRNEERFIWYAVNSVLPHVDKIMVWDTGSTDRTVSIINLIKSPKLEFKEVGPVDINTFTQIRQQMLNATPKIFDWLMVLDGDEIWSSASIKAAVSFCNSHSQSQSLVVRTRNLVGDLYHSLPESAGKYHLASRVGHLNLRFINLKNTPGLHVNRPHGQQGYFNAQNRLIQDLNPSFLDIYYHHATHLIRSSIQTIKRSQKLKYELGDKTATKDLPEIFFIPHPPIVPDITLPAPVSFWIQAAIQTPFRHLKRLLLPPSHGY